MEVNDVVNKTKQLENELSDTSSHLYVKESELSKVKRDKEALIKRHNQLKFQVGAILLVLLYCML